MQHRNLRTRASAVKRFALAAAAMLATIAATTAFTSHTATATATAAARPAAVQQVTASPAASPAAPAAATPAARAFRKYFRHQAATGTTAWISTGTERDNEAILMQARGDAYPHRNAALAAAARNGLAHPSPVDTAGWNKIMHDELTIARQLPIPVQCPAATIQATIIRHDYLAFARATS
jgi:hypothetical protein